MNARRIVLAAFVTAVAGLSLACSAGSGEELGRTDEALLPCTGLECNGGPTPQPAPGPWVNNCGHAGVLGSLSPDAGALYDFEAALKALGCDTMVVSEFASGTGHPEEFGTSCPVSSATVRTTCPNGIQNVVLAGGQATVNLQQLLSCYAGRAPVSPDEATVDPCTGEHVEDGVWIDFDPTCTGRGCTVIPSGPGGIKL